MVLPEAKDVEDNYTRGFIMMVISTVTMVAANVSSKLQFEDDPTLTISELLFARGIITLIALAIWLNKNLKEDLIDSIDCKSLYPLIFRCISGGIVQVIAFTSLKYFNISTVGSVCSLAPICVCIMAYFILNERMNKIDCLFLCAVFCSVMLVLMGTGKENGGGGGPTIVEAATLAPTLAATIGLGCLPILISGQVIANRQMKK